MVSEDTGIDSCAYQTGSMMKICFTMLHQLKICLVVPNSGNIQ